jgi:hypothetical protein
MDMSNPSGASGLIDDQTNPPPASPVGAGTRAPKRRAVWIGALVGVGGLLGGMGLSGGALAAASGTSSHFSAGCSDATLHGRYNFATESTQVSGPAPNGPFAYAGFVYYDGRGGNHEVYTISAAGEVSRLVSETGTYHVNSDCTGSETDTAAGGGTQHYDEFVSPDGSQFAYIQTDSGIVSAGTLTRTGNAQSSR